MPKDDPASLLREAIQLHQAHMDGTEPTSEASQQKLMRLLEDALTAVTSMAASAANITRNPRGFVLLAAEQITDQGLQWIEVMPTAEKARNGRFYFTVTPDDLETYAQSIRDQPGLIPVDYDHEGASDGSTRAAGWFTGQARVENGVLLAEVKWTPKAAEEIKAGEYKRISPEFSFVDVDEKTGLMTRAKEILAATLTNRPFFRELAPVGAEVVWAPDAGLEQLRQKLHAALNPGTLDSARYWVMDIAANAALVQEYQTARTWAVPFIVGDGGDVAPADPSEWAEAEQQWVAAAQEAIQVNGPRRPFTDVAFGAVWSTAFVNSLPDSSFLWVESGGEKDSEGKTTPRSLRHFPYKDAAGKIDLPHLRNAAARIPQSSVPDDVKRRLARRVEQLLNQQNTQTTKEKTDMELTVIAKTLGLPEDATEEQVNEKLKSLQQENMELKATAASTEDGRVEKLEQLLTEERVKRVTGEREQVLAQAVRDGRIVPAQKDALIVAFGGETPDDGSVTALRAFVESAPIRSSKEIGTGGEGEQEPDLKAAAAEFETSDGIRVDDESARLHVTAEALLRQDGKGEDYTSEEYLRAVARAEAGEQPKVAA